jgi:hypothetical protein
MYVVVFFVVCWMLYGILNDEDYADTFGRGLERVKYAKNKVGDSQVLHIEDKKEYREV